MATQHPSAPSKPTTEILPDVLNRRLPGTPAWAYRGRAFWDTYHATQHKTTPAQDRAA